MIFDEHGMFCSVCGREIYCDDELGKVDERKYNISGHRNSTTTVYCVDCLEEAKKEIK